MLWTILWAAFTMGGLVWTFRRSPFFYWIWGTMAVALMIVLLLRNTDAELAAFWADLFVIVVGLILAQGRMRLVNVIDCLEWGTKNALAIGAACAAVGFIVGTTTLTGLGLKIANATIYLANVSASFIMNFDFLNLFQIDHITLIFTLLYTAVACLILGMGLPTTPNYIVVSIIAAPALLKFGVVPLVAHMFVFYYGIMADLTPPVAVAAYAASGISQGDPFKTGVRAFTLAWAEMYVPFAFVFSPILILMPWILEKTRGPFPWMDFLFVFATVLLGVIALGAILIGYFGDRVTPPERIGLVISLGLLWWHEQLSSIIGFFLVMGIYLFQTNRRRRRETALAREAPSPANPGPKP